MHVHMNKLPFATPTLTAPTYKTPTFINLDPYLYISSICPRYINVNLYWSILAHLFSNTTIILSVVTLYQD